MTTAITMITDSMRLANIIMETETPSAEMGEQGLRVFNQMMGQWHRDGIELGWQQITDLDDTLPLDYQDERAVRFNLAVELAGEYGIEPLRHVLKTAIYTYDQLAKAHRKEVECSLDHLPVEDAYATGAGTIEDGGL